MTPAKKPNAGVPGVKMLIAAASLAATVGGWALLSSKDSAPSKSDPVLDPPMPTASAPVLTVKLAPLPTLMPPPAQSQLVTVNNQPALVSSSQAIRKAPAAAPAAPAPQALPALREVSAPAPRGSTSSGAPAPVASTKSSR